MADYNVTARFEADAAGYINAVNQAKQATQDLGDAADKAGKSTGKAFDGADKSVEKTGTAAEKASKQTDGLGDSAADAGSQAQDAFDGAETGIEATGTSAETAGASVDGLGDAATQAGGQAQTAFDGVTDGIDAASISLDGAAGDYSNLGDAAQQSGSQAASAFDNVTDGIDAANISIDGAAGSYSSLGDTAQQSGSQAQTAFDGAATGLDAASTAAEGASTSVAGFSDAAGHAGKHAQSAFENIADGVNAANISLDGAKGKYVDLGNTASVSMQKAAQGIRNNAQEMQQLGGAMAVVGGGLTAISVGAATVGIQYNSLRQTATKSLESVAGSTEAAANQMRKLDDYGQNSWLMRDTLIRAQQNMSGFGIETEKVIPYMEALAEAVAGSTGSQQDFEELARVMGKIESQGKITARELEEFGVRGIDAAQLIGDAMGLTADEIRDQITAGALDAGDALDALSEGMMMNFEGASDRLRDTWQGAFDNLKAGFRDLSAISFDFLVDPEGGGWMVDLANNAADLLYSLQDLPGPILNVAGGLAVAGGAATTAAGGFLLLAPQAMDAWDAFQRIAQATGATDVLNSIRDRAPGAATALKNVGKYAGIAAVAMAGMKLVGELITDDQIYDVEDLDEAVQNLANTGVSSGIDRMFSDWANIKLPGVKNSTDDIVDMESAMARLAEPKTNSEKFNQWADRAFAWTGAAQSDLTQIEEKVSDFGDSLAGMVNEGEIEAASNAFNVLADSFTDNGGEVEDLIDLMPSYIDSLMGTAEAAGVTITESEALEWALTGIAPAAVEAAGGLDDVGAAGDNFTVLGEKADSASASVEGVTDKIRALGDEFRSTFLNEGDMYAAIDNFTEALAENGATLDATTEAGQANRQALVEMFDASEEYAASILEAGGATEDAAGAMRTTYDTMVDNAEAMGLSKGEAESLAAELLNIPEGVNIDTFFDETAREMALALANEIEAIPDHKVIGVAMQEDGSFVSVQQAVNDLGETVTVIVDAEGNVTEVTEEIREIDGHQVTVYVDDDGTVYELEGDLEEISQSRHSTTVEVEADPEGAQSEIDGIEGGEATVDTNADTSDAEYDLQSVTGRPWLTSITGVPYMSDAESSANTTARDRFPLFSGVPQMGTAESTANTTARDRFPLFSGVPQMGVAETAANTTARERSPIFTGIPRTATAERGLNDTARERDASINASKGNDGVSGWLSNLIKPRTVSISAVVKGAAGALGLASGGIAGETKGVGHYNNVPKLATGGRLPYTGLGQDMILGRNRHGVPTAWVDDGEWVVREQMSRKYHQALGLINADHPSIQHLAGLADGGQAGRTRLASNVSSGATSIDYTRLAEALGDRRNVTYQANLSNANSTMHDAMDAFQRMDMAESRR